METDQEFWEGMRRSMLLIWCLGVLTIVAIRSCKPLIPETDDSTPIPFIVP